MTNSEVCKSMSEATVLEHDVLEYLAEAVAAGIERTYRLGYSAVIWRNGKCVEISGEKLRADPSTDRGTD